MLYRLYDHKNKCWVDDFYISPTGDVVIPKKFLFGIKLNIESDLRYTYHIKTGLWDKNGDNIYEGDICKLNIEDNNIFGVVAYAERDASFYVFDDVGTTYYPLNQAVCDEHVEVVGNVIDGIKENKESEI